MLNPDRPKIPIGRASKSVSKGLLSAEDNAWFDNPVMSRDHAELVFSQDTMVSSHLSLISIKSANCEIVCNDQRHPIYAWHTT